MLFLKIESQPTRKLPFVFKAHKYLSLLFNKTPRKLIKLAIFTNPKYR